MSNKYITTTALAAVCAATLAIQLQAQAQPAPAGAQQPAGTQAVASSKKTEATIIGCVYRENDIPGRSPNAAERVGVAEDYILAAITTTPVGQRAAGAGVQGATGTSGQAASDKPGAEPRFTAMYKLEFVKDTKAQTFVGRRVEVTGQIDAEEGDSRGPTAATPTSTTDKIIGRDRVNLSEFEVASIKDATAGSCPAKPFVQ